jgi:hypothetical protein
MKYICLIIFLTASVYSQNVNEIYYSHASKVADFDTSRSVISSSMEGEIDIKNSQGDVMRFMINKVNGLGSYHGGIAFILYDWTSGWLSRIVTYDIDGKIKGDAEFNDLAIIELEIKDMGMLHAKFESLDAVDGNTNTNDADSKTILQKTYNSKGSLIKEEYINTSDYWKMYHLLYRP